MNLPYKPNLTVAQLARVAITESAITESRIRELQEDHLVLQQAMLKNPNVAGVGVTADDKGLALLVLLKKENRSDAALYGGNSRHGWRILTRVSGELVPAMPADGEPAYDEPGQLGAVFTGLYRPVPGGVSVGPVDRKYAGTLGCQVVANGVTYMLSNNHVLADVNRLPIGAAISQPALLDLQPANPVGKLARFVPMVPHDPSNPVYNHADAAIASYDKGIVPDFHLLGAAGTQYGLADTVVAPVLGAEVQKSGRTTGYTVGRITTIGMTTRSIYADGREYWFADVFEIASVNADELFSTGGDSGSVVSLTKANNPVGLIFASADDKKLSYANPMSAVLTALGNAGKSETFSIKG